MMKYARLTTLALVTFMLASPTAAIPRDRAIGTGLAGQALLCFYRGLDWNSKVEFYGIRIQDEAVGGLARGSFLHHLTTPGRRIIVVTADTSVSRSFELQGGIRYYIRIDRKDTGFLNLPKLLPVKKAKGVREIRQLNDSGAERSPMARQYCLREDLP